MLKIVASSGTGLRILVLRPHCPRHVQSHARSPPGPSYLVDMAYVRIALLCFLRSDAQMQAVSNAQRLLGLAWGPQLTKAAGFE